VPPVRALAAWLRYRCTIRAGVSAQGELPEVL